MLGDENSPSDRGRSHSLMRSNNGQGKGAKRPHAKWENL